MRRGCAGLVVPSDNPLLPVALQKRTIGTHEISIDSHCQVRTCPMGNSRNRVPGRDEVHSTAYLRCTPFCRVTDGAGAV